MAKLTGPTTRRVSVLVADNSKMGCQLLADALEQSPYGLRVIACAHTSREMLQAASEHEPRVALISANLEGGQMSGVRALHELRASGQKTLPVVLVDSAEPELVVEAFRAGAKGIFSRSEPVAALGKCIRAVHSGQIWASARELQFLLEALALSAPPRWAGKNGVIPLTKREEEVVRSVMEGMTNREISRRLNLSEHTVKNYLFRLFEKLGISSRVDLILYALQNRSPHPLQDQLGAERKAG